MSLIYKVHVTLSAFAFAFAPSIRGCLDYATETLEQTINADPWQSSRGLLSYPTQAWLTSPRPVWHDGKCVVPFLIAIYAIRLLN